METMIPNEVRFDLDLQDLPARATQISPEALSLSGGNSCEWRTNDTNPISYNLSQYCPHTCSSAGLWWNGHTYRYDSARLPACSCCR